MHTVMIKTVMARDGLSIVRTTTASNVSAGIQPDRAINWAVTHVPDDIDELNVLALFRRTAIWRPGDYRVRYDELGDGNLVRGDYRE